MPIYVNKKQTQFHLQGKEVSYLLNIIVNGQLGHLYYGRKVSDQEDFSDLALLPNEPIGNAAFPFEGDSQFSLEWLKQEYPSYGTSDYREPALELKEPEGTRICHFTYRSHEIVNGKPSLKDMPSTYAENDLECQTIQFTLEDAVLKAQLLLSYTVYHDRNVITRHAEIMNRGAEAFSIERFMSTSVDFPHADFDLLKLDGAWIRERHAARQKIGRGVQSFDSKRGVSSSWHNPFLALMSPQATELNGEVFGFNLVYSGNFKASVEVDAYDTTRLLLGINPFGFSWNLQPGESFMAPEAVMVYSYKGLNDMSQTFHSLYKERLVRGLWKEKERPVLINNWEATYFNFNEEKLASIAESSSKLGVELFVLDDGWFQGRNDDTTSLGDWKVDREKLPGGLDSLAEKVSKEGLKFGLWVEPEMISEKSNLFKEHPEWVLKANHRPHSHGRHQMVLDLTRPDVQKFVIQTLTEILFSGGIQYVKWDMNRTLTEIGSSHLSKAQQGEVTHRYVLGLYRILQEITDVFPDVLFESCASGGNRFDPGMLYYMPQTWASDNTDAVERIKIQYGTSIVYPLSSMGAHISAVPNHQTGRVTPMDFRYHVAMFGAFGYELDPTNLNEVEQHKVKNQIQRYKKERKLLQYGRFYRLVSPFEENDAAWMVVDETLSEAIVAFYRVNAKPNPGMKRILLAGLDEDTWYEVEWQEGSDTKHRLYKGDELMRIGWMIPPFYTGTIQTSHTHFYGDFASAVWKFRAVKKG